MVAEVGPTLEIQQESGMHGSHPQGALENIFLRNI